jgi:hypothetical protein
MRVNKEIDRKIFRALTIVEDWVELEASEYLITVDGYYEDRFVVYGTDRDQKAISYFRHEVE